jgi:hypothetical protein
MEPGSACPHPCGWPSSCAGGRILNACGSRSKGRFPHQEQGKSDEDQNGLSEAEVLDWVVKFEVCEIREALRNEI